MWSRLAVDNDGRSDPLVGFACRWRRPRDATWSRIPSSLLPALRSLDPGVLDLPVEGSLWGDRVLNNAHRLVTRDRPGSWRAAKPAIWRAEWNLRRQVRRTGPDAVVCIGELGIADARCFHYVDLTYSAIADLSERLPVETVLGGPFHKPGRDAWQQRRERRVFGESAGMLAMSRWIADLAVAHGLVEPERVSVVGAGRSATVSGDASEIPRRRTTDPRVLFVGAQFHRKGGDLVLAAVRHLRQHGWRARLTIAGPAEWPMTEPAPDWVDFRGFVAASEVTALMSTHDVFAMPSRFEAFGIVFAEALAAGLPSVARRAFAMPEIVEDNVTGLLVESDDIDELAGAIRRCAEDDELRANCQRGAAVAAERYSWPAVAERILEVVKRRSPASTGPMSQ